MNRASDLPQRRAGSHTRSGNAMLRTRTAIVDAAAQCIEHDGLRAMTMSAVGARAGIAKATLYNHFRAKDDVLFALVESRVTRLTTECSELAAAGLAPALEHAAGWLSDAPSLRRLRAHELPALVVLAAPAPGPLWDLARAGIETVLRESGAPNDASSIDLVLRWLCSFVLSTGAPEAIVTAAAVVAAGLGRAPEPPPVDEPEPAVAGVGWPGSAAGEGE